MKKFGKWIVLFCALLGAITVSACSKNKEVVLNGFDVPEKIVVEQYKDVVVDVPIVTENGKTLDVKTEVSDSGGGKVAVVLGAFTASDIGGYTISFTVTASDGKDYVKTTKVEVEPEGTAMHTFKLKLPETINAGQDYAIGSDICVVADGTDTASIQKTEVFFNGVWTETSSVFNMPWSGKYDIRFHFVYDGAIDLINAEITVTGVDYGYNENTDFHYYKGNDTINLSALVRTVPSGLNVSYTVSAFTAGEYVEKTDVTIADGILSHDKIDSRAYKVDAYLLADNPIFGKKLFDTFYFDYDETDTPVFVENSVSQLETNYWANGYHANWFSSIAYEDASQAGSESPLYRRKGAYISVTSSRENEEFGVCVGMTPVHSKAYYQNLDQSLKLSFEYYYAINGEAQKGGWRIKEIDMATVVASYDEYVARANYDYVLHSEWVGYGGNTGQEHVLYLGNVAICAKVEDSSVSLTLPSVAQSEATDFSDVSVTVNGQSCDVLKVELNYNDNWVVLDSFDIPWGGEYDVRVSYLYQIERTHTQKLTVSGSDFQYTDCTEKLNRYVNDNVNLKTTFESLNLSGYQSYDISYESVKRLTSGQWVATEIKPVNDVIDKNDLYTGAYSVGVYVSKKGESADGIFGKKLFATFYFDYDETDEYVFVPNNEFGANFFAAGYHANWGTEVEFIDASQAGSESPLSGKSGMFAHIPMSDSTDYNVAMAVKPVHTKAYYDAIKSDYLLAYEWKYANESGPWKTEFIELEKIVENFEHRLGNLDNTSDDEKLKAMLFSQYFAPMEGGVKRDKDFYGGNIVLVKKNVDVSLTLPTVEAGTATTFDGITLTVDGKPVTPTKVELNYNDNWVVLDSFDIPWGGEYDVRVSYLYQIERTHTQKLTVSGSDFQYTDCTEKLNRYVNDNVNLKTTFESLNLSGYQSYDISYESVKRLTSGQWVATEIKPVNDVIDKNDLYTGAYSVGVYVSKKGESADGIFGKKLFATFYFDYDETDEYVFVPNNEFGANFFAAGYHANWGTEVEFIDASQAGSESPLSGKSGMFAHIPMSDSTDYNVAMAVKPVHTKAYYDAIKSDYLLAYEWKYANESGPWKTEFIELEKIVENFEHRLGNLDNTSDDEKLKAMLFSQYFAPMEGGVKRDKDFYGGNIVLVKKNVDVSLTLPTVEAGTATTFDGITLTVDGKPVTPTKVEISDGEDEWSTITSFEFVFGGEYNVRVTYLYQIERTHTQKLTVSGGEQITLVTDTALHRIIGSDVDGDNIDLMTVLASIKKSNGNLFDYTQENITVSFEVTYAKWKESLNGTVWERTNKYQEAVELNADGHTIAKSNLLSVGYNVKAYAESRGMKKQFASFTFDYDPTDAYVYCDDALLNNYFWYGGLEYHPNWYVDFAANASWVDASEATEGFLAGKSGMFWQLKFPGATGGETNISVAVRPSHTKAYYQQAVSDGYVRLCYDQYIKKGAEQKETTLNRWRTMQTLVIDRYDDYVTLDTGVTDKSYEPLLLSHNTNGDPFYVADATYPVEAYLGNIRLCRAE